MIQEGTLYTSSGLLYHVGADKKAKVVLLEHETKAKIKELHESEGTHKKRIRHDFAAKYYAPNSNIKALTAEVVAECSHCQLHTKVTDSKEETIEANPVHELHGACPN